MNQNILAALLLLALSAATHAAKPGEEGASQAAGYLGKTSTSYNGSTYMAELYAACQTDYGDGARVCNTKELFESPSLAGEILPVEGMLVRPFIIGFSGDGSTSQGMDYTGGKATNFQGCGGSTTANAAVLIRRNWQFDTQGYCGSVRPVACCR